MKTNERKSWETNERRLWDGAIEQVLGDCKVTAKNRRDRFELFMAAISMVTPDAELRQIRRDVGPWYGRRTPAARVAAAA